VRRGDGAAASPGARTGSGGGRRGLVPRGHQSAALGVGFISRGSDSLGWGFTGRGDVLDSGASQDQHWEVSHTQDQRYDEDRQRPDTTDDRVL
jgi:hypothetical protein